MEKQKLARVQLVARALIAREAAAEALERARCNRTSRARSILALARERLAVLNRALAVLALQASAA